MTRIFIVGLIKADRQWEFIGAFTSKELAEAACRTENHFIGESELDKDIGDATIAWPDAYFPGKDKASV